MLPQLLGDDHAPPDTPYRHFIMPVDQSNRAAMLTDVLYVNGYYLHRILREIHDDH
jgi:hypothetical protein